MVVSKTSFPQILVVISWFDESDAAEDSDEDLELVGGVWLEFGEEMFLVGMGFVPGVGPLTEVQIGLLGDVDAH